MTLLELGWSRQDEQNIFGIVKLLTILTAVTKITCYAYADADKLLVPRHGVDPVMVRFAGGSAEQEVAGALELLYVYVGGVERNCEGRTPIGGRYEIDSCSLTFTAAFGFVMGQDYVACVLMPVADEDFVPFTIRSDGPPVDASVTATSPSGDILPEDVLRFHIHFSTPMSPQVAFN